MDNRALGARAEEAAARALRGRGYRILARNVRSRLGELDLVCADRGAFVFCEVKARRRSGFGGPLEALTAAKRARLARLGASYLARIGRSGARWRLELVAVWIDDRGDVEALEVLPLF